MNTTKKILFSGIITLIIIFGSFFITEQYRKIRYGEFKKVGLLNNVRCNHKSILIDDYIFTYGGTPGYTSSKSNSIEIYNIKENKSLPLNADIVKNIELTTLDVVKPWNNYLIILRKGMHRKNLEGTIGYYNLKTNQFDRIIKPNYTDNYSDFLILNNGDIVLLANENAEKYSFKNNTFGKLFISKEKNKHKFKLFYNDPTLVPLKKDSFLLISISSATVYENSSFKPVEKIQFNIEDFSDFYHVGQLVPQFIALNNGKFVVFSYDKKTHLNKIRIYEYKNSKIALISNYETKKIRHALTSGEILKLNDNQIVILGGEYGIPAFLTFKTRQNYLFDVVNNKLSRITSLKDGYKHGFSTIVYDGSIFILGGYQNDYIRDIEIWKFNK